MPKTPTPPKNKDRATAFDTSYALLNAAQKEAVDAIEGPVMVIAGPGTGKTTILTLRIANILRRTDAGADSILALTFTESGAFAMRRKLADIIGGEAYKVNIHTFHGFAESVIQEYPDYFPRVIGSAIVGEADQIGIVRKILESGKFDLLRPYGDPLFYVRSILHEIHLLKRENVSPAALLKSVKADQETVECDDGKKPSAGESEKRRKRDLKNHELALAYKKYEEELARLKYYDFDDMLLELIRAMEKTPEFKLILQEKYQYILADEHQDANASQNRILELLSDFHASPNLFIVGDEKQAIYRFQGASLKNFLYFKEKYPDACVITLLHNYRSHQIILDAAHSLIRNNPAIAGQEPAKLLALQVGGRPIRIVESSDKGAELEFVAMSIKKLIEERKEKPEEIAVFFRENSHARDIGAKLRGMDIPCRNESDQDILSGVDAMKSVILARAIADPSNDECLGKALLLGELGCDPADVSHLFRLARNEDLPLHKVIRGAASGQIKAAYVRIVQWSRESQTLPFPDFLHKLLGETGIVLAAVESGSLERMNALLVFFDTVTAAARSKQTFYLKDFIDYIDTVAVHGAMSKRSNNEHVEGVRLMTAHRSKGLEFNYVFIIHAIDGVWGNRRSRSLFNVPIIEHARDAGRVEDERRLFYVAMTRAREGVTISYSLRDGDKQSLKSQFVDEIDRGLVAFEKMEEDEALLSPFLQALPAGLISVGESSTSTAAPILSAGPRMSAPIHSKDEAASRRPSILDSKYVRSKFLAQPFSVSHLNSYLECPWRYFFLNLIRLPQVHSKKEMYGTAVHLALKSFFNAYKDGRDLSKKQLVDLFRHNLETQTMSKADREASFEKGRKALEGYFDEYGKTWNRNLFAEYSVRGCLSVDPETRLEITGKLDKIELSDGGEATVVDYKTGKPQSRNEIEGKTRDANGNYKRQLTFYKLLLDGDKKFRMKHGEIDFIEANERGIHKKERFEITDKEVEDLKMLISKVAGEILSLSFVDKECGEKNCEFCRLGRVIR